MVYESNSTFDRFDTTPRTTHTHKSTPTLNARASAILRIAARRHEHTQVRASSVSFCLFVLCSSKALLANSSSRDRRSLLGIQPSTQRRYADDPNDQEMLRQVHLLLFLFKQYVRCVIVRCRLLVDVPRMQFGFACLGSLFDARCCCAAPTNLSGKRRTNSRIGRKSWSHQERRFWRAARSPSAHT